MEVWRFLFSWLAIFCDLGLISTECNVSLY
jgi:hypothetical protein